VVLSSHKANGRTLSATLYYVRSASRLLRERYGIARFPQESQHSCRNLNIPTGISTFPQDCDDLPTRNWEDHGLLSKAISWEKSSLSLRLTAGQLCSRGLQPAFAFGTLCPQAGAERGLKPATTLIFPNTDRNP